MEQGVRSPVVPMHFYASWDVDRTSSSAIPRTLSMKFTKLTLTKALMTENAFIIAVKLQGHRRILRSSDINVISSQKLIYLLDISFTIQYCHFIKRKSNILEIFIQRRKKYKNRQIPGFKTLAFGNVNLDEVLQQGGSREISIWDTACLKRLSVQDFHAGTIFIANCQTQVVDSGEPDPRQKGSGKYTNILSEEEVDDDSSQDDSDFDEFDHRRQHHEQSKRSQKKIKQKNIKQKVVALLKKFRVPEEVGNGANVSGSSSSRVLPPTELELQEIFEELENISDSGPELEPDKMSIISNPRPGLRPFFGSKSDILPAIKDDQIQSDDSIGDSDEVDQESSEEVNKDYWVQKAPIESGAVTLTEPLPPHSNRFPMNISEVSGGQNAIQRERLKHSLTINSIQSNHTMDGLKTTGVTPLSSARSIAPSNKRSLDNSLFIEMLSQHDANSSAANVGSSVVPNNIWLSSSADLPWIANVNSSMLENVRLFDCSNLADIRAVLHIIIGRIQKFCNSNSAAPSTARIGIIGGDKLVSHVLRTYVELLQSKASQDWPDYLRFSIVVPQNTAIGRLFGQISASSDYLDSVWRVLSKLSPAFENGSPDHNDYSELDGSLTSLTGSSTGQQKLLNLSIGEVMLQLQTSGNAPLVPIDSSAMDDKNNSQIFIPFLSELYLGSYEDFGNMSLFLPKSSCIDENAGNPVAISTQSSTVSGGGPSPSSQYSQTAPSLSNATGSLSPPVSPYSHKSYDGRELHVEYWTVASSSNGPNLVHYNQQQEPTCSSSSKSQAINVQNNNKFSMKAAVRNLSVSRDPTTNLLCLWFIKVKQKEKVLQKLGRKTKQKSISDFNSQSRIVSSVTRMVCSSNKNCCLDVSIDGVKWSRIRYFQISGQWQTHVKLFPIGFPMTGKQ